MAYLPTVDKNAKYSNGQHIAVKDTRKITDSAFSDIRLTTLSQGTPTTHYTL